jgi:hypothetical protein
MVKFGGAKNETDGVILDLLKFADEIVGRAREQGITIV